MVPLSHSHLFLYPSSHLPVHLSICPSVLPPFLPSFHSSSYLCLCPTTNSSTYPPILPSIPPPAHPFRLPPTTHSLSHQRTPASTQSLSSTHPLTSAPVYSLIHLSARISASLPSHIAPHLPLSPLVIHTLPSKWQMKRSPCLAALMCQ